MTRDTDTYYEFHRRHVRVRGDERTFFTRRALGPWKETATPVLLLAETMELPADARVLNLHCGNGLVGAVAARIAAEGHVTLLDANSVAVEAARRTLDANDATNAEVLWADCAQPVLGRTFDVILALCPRTRALREQTILDAATLLRPGGRFYIAGANKLGIKTAERFTKEIFGNAEAVAYKSGCRVVTATRQEEVETASSDYYNWRRVAAEVAGQRLEYATKPGLFSWEELDEGTRLLIEALLEKPLYANSRVLDVGCGAGVLTLVAARQAQKGNVTAVDVDCRAVEATRRTLALNNVANAEVLCSDCAEAVQRKTFTAIVTNPPFHHERASTYAVAEQIIRDAARILKQRGRLFLVANAFLKYRPLLDAAFGHVELLRQTNAFKVWLATKGDRWGGA